MKRSKKALFTAVTAALACALTSGLAMTAFADDATKDHEFDVKKDVVFEDFDRADISNTVTTTDADKVNLGEKPYMHAQFDAITDETSAGDRNSQIYKQGSGSLARVKDGGAIKIKMRAPEGGLALSQLNFAVRGVDNEEQVCIKGFDELFDSEQQELPELTDSWAEYEISFAASYESTDVYPGTNFKVTGEGSKDLLGFHIFADANVDGVLDIASIEYKTGSGTYMRLNDFTGGDDVVATAKSADSATWWAGSNSGSVVKRVPTLSAGGEMTVVKETAVGRYSYAVIETEGDITGLKIATTTDGTSFGALEAYDGYSVALTGEEKGFKFVNDGEESVKIKRIYLTNLEVLKPDTATPVIDAKSAKLLEDFGAAQNGFTDDYDAMVTAVTDERLYYRMSYNSGDKVEIKDGMLVFDATELGSNLINFKFQAKTAISKKYVVLKMKQEGEGANLNDFRFGLIDGEGATSDPIYANSLKSGIGYSSKLLDDSNPYKDGEWYYVIVDIEQSGFPTYSGYAGLNMYYSGKGKLYFDEIFFADEKDLPLVDVTKPLDTQKEFAATDVDAYEYLYIPSDGTYQTLSFDITPGADDFDISNLRLEINGSMYWASENAAGTLLTPDGKMLNELEFRKGEATHITIDLVSSGIVGAFSTVHVHTFGAATGGFTVTDAKFTPYKDMLSEYYTEAVNSLSLYLDAENPVVQITNETTATAGDEIAITYTASDNKTASTDLTVEITVTKDGSEVPLTNSKFTAEEGVYTVTVKVTDAAGNEATDVKQITVGKKSETSSGGTSGGGKKLKGGEIAGIVVGSVAGVGLIAVGVYFLVRYLRKKKEKK